MGSANLILKPVTAMGKKDSTPKTLKRHIVDESKNTEKNAKSADEVRCTVFKLNVYNILFCRMIF